MSFKPLTELLTRLGEKDIEVRRVAVLKFGCTCLSEIPDTREEEQFPVTAREKLMSSLGKGDSGGEELKEAELYEALIKALEKSPNVFNLKKRPAASKNSVDLGYFLSFGGSTGMFIEGDLFSLEVEVPERIQKYTEIHWGFSRKPIQKFKAISNGALFAVFAPISGYPGSTSIGQEYRELVSAQVDSETRFRSLAFGPVPMHSDFYLIFGKRDVAADEESPRVYSSGDDIFLVYDESAELSDAAEELFWAVGYEAMKFYRLQMDDSLLLEYDTEISNSFSELSDAVKGMVLDPWWNPYRKLKIARKGRKSLADTFTRLVEFETHLLSYNRSRAQLLDSVKRNRIISPVRHHIAEVTETEARVPSGLSSALEYFAAEVQTFRNITSILFGSLVGAGAVLLAALLTRLLSGGR